MATCSQIIQLKVSSGDIYNETILSPRHSTPLSISPSNKQIFWFSTTIQQTVHFFISLSSIIQPSNIGVTVSIFQITNQNVLINLRSSFYF